jgi:hypothetical protein
MMKLLATYIFASLIYYNLKRCYVYSYFINEVISL